MSTQAIRIRIGAALDSSVEKSFATVEARAGRYAQNSARAMQKGNDAIAKGAQNVATDQERAAARAATAQERAAARNSAAAERAAAKIARTNARTAAEGEKAAKKLHDGFADSFTKIADVAAREMRKVEQATERANRRANDRFATRTSYGAARFLTPHAPLASLARRTASDIARGAGVDLDVGNSVGRNVDLESAAVGLSNQAVQENTAGPNGQRQDPKALIAEARSVGNDLSLAPQEALAGLEAFVTKTGDLQTGREALRGMAELSVAVGAGLENAVDAAADVSLNLGDVPNKGKVIQAIMSTIAGQGKMGAVELKQLATQMAKIASAASQFKGDTGENIKALGAFAQVARAHGGASSATISATSIASFLNTLKTPARIEQFRKAGVIGGSEQLTDLSPIEIVKRSLSATGGNQEALKKMFANVQGARSLEGFSNLYRKASDASTAAGGNKQTANAAGIAAVEQEFAKYMNATVSQGLIRQNVDAHNATTKSTAQRFQNSLDEIVQKSQDKLVPALEKLTPVLLEFAGTLGKVTTWAVDSPKQAIATAMALSIARAGLENTVRSGLERLIRGAQGQSPGPGFAAGGTIANLGAAVNIAALAVASLTVGEAIIDHFFTKAQEDQRKDVAAGIAQYGELGKVKALAASGHLPEAKERAEALVEAQRARLDETKSGASRSYMADEFMQGLARIVQYIPVEGIGNAVGADLGKNVNAGDTGSAMQHRRQLDAENIRRQEEALRASTAAIKALTSAMNSLPATIRASPDGGSDSDRGSQ